MLEVASFSSYQVLLISSLLAPGWLAAAAATTATIPNPPSVRSSAAKQPQAVANYGKLPLSFEPNQGQTDPSVKFISRGSGYALFLTSDGAVLALGQSGRRPADCNSSLLEIAPQPASCEAASAGGQDVFRMTLAGAANQGHITQATGEEPLPGKVNYFLGNDPMRWHTDLPTYSKVRYSGVYPGVDLVYYGNQRQLEYDFVVAPEAESSRIHLQFAGASSFQIHIAADGDLVLQGANGEAIFHKPVAYQEKDGRRQLIPASFHLAAANTLGFSLGAYDHSRQLIIDPVLSYSTYLGGSGTNGNGDEGNGIAVDSAGDAYVVGTTYSTNFPVTPVAFQSANNAALAENGSTVFISELNPAGTALVYSTYLGGSGTAGSGDFGYGIAVDSANNVYVTGATYSADFPVTCGAFLTTDPSTTSGAPTGFVAELSPTANALVYSTYLGGSGNGASPAEGDVAQAIAVDSAGDAFVTGYTFSPNFPVSDKAFQAEYAGTATTSNAFVTKLSPSGTALLYSTYLGGSGGDYGNSLAIDASGDAFVAGSTASSNFPVTSGAFQPTLLGPSNGFVTQLNPAGAEEVYSTYLGGSGQVGSVFYAYNNPSTGDSAIAIAVDSGGFAYVAGNTTSSDFPVTAGALEGAGDFDAGTGFVTKLSSNGSSLVYSTYLEGVGTSVSGLAVDSAGTAYVTGSVPSVSADLSDGFIATADALPAPVSTGSAAFLVKLSPSATGLNFASIVGGTANDAATAVAVDAAGNAYLTGVATSTDFPTTSGVVQSAKGAAGVANAFISKFSLAKETNQTAYPANPSNVATTMTDEGPDEIVLNCSPPPSFYGFYMGVSVSLNTDLGGPPPTGTITFEDSLNYNFQNYGPYTIPFFGLGWGGGETTYNFSDGQQFDGPEFPFSISWSVAYSGDAYYAASGYSGSVSSPGCPPPSSSVGLAPKEDSRHILMDLRPKQAGTAQDALRSRSEQFRVPGPKFTPRSASAHEDGQRSQAVPAIRNQAAASCLAPVVVATPVFSPAAGTYTSSQSVTISDATPGATIYYTTNGTVPTSSSTMYVGAISVSGTETIQAIAVATGYPDSAIASATYTTNLPGTFGSVPVNIGSSTAATVTVTIPSAATLGSISVVTQGAPNLDFTNAGGGSCTVGHSYAANDTCTVEAEFAPRYPGVRSGAVVLFDNSGNVLASVYLEGMGSGPQTTFSAGFEQLIASNLYFPYILLDQNGNLYIAPANSSEITQETPSGSGYIQSTFSLNGRLGPMAIDGAGNFFVASPGTLYKETRSSSGYVESTIDAGLSQLFLSDIAVDGKGNLYLATVVSSNTVNPSYDLDVVMETPGPGGYTSSVLFNGTVNCNAQGSSGDNVCSPHLAVDASGNVYVTANTRVLELSPTSGNYTSNWIVAGLSFAEDIAVDALGNLFIADNTGYGRVVKETPWNGSYVQTIVSSSPLFNPTHVAIDQTGNIYIVDSGPQSDTENYLIQRLLKENYSTPPSLTFAATSPGVTSSDSPRTVVVTNDGTAPLNFSGVTYPVDFPETTQLPGACTPSISLPSGANCVLTINFKPESLPPNDDNPFLVRGVLTILTDTFNSAATTQEILLNGQVTRAANTVYIHSSPNPSQAGSSVRFEAAVAGAAAGPVPTGSVTFFSGASALATVSLTGGIAVFSTSALPKGTNSVYATYSGDSVYTSATSNSIAQIVGMSIPALTLTSSTSSSYVGTPILFTAMVAGVPNTPSPTGTVTFLSGATNLGSVPVVSGAATLPISFPAVGTQTVTASYSGDSNYVPAVSLNGVDVTLTLAQFFGSSPPLTVGSTTPVTVTIPSAATLTGISILTLGIPNQDFTKAVGGTCSVGTVYAQGATCTVNVAFNPTHAGIHSGAVAVMDSTSSTNVISTVYLQGTLDGPQLAFSSNVFNSLGSVPIYPATPFASRVPGGVAVDPSGNLFVAAVGSGVTKWTLANGAYSQTNLTTSGGPGIAIDGRGNLFVACGASLCKLSPQSNGSYSQSIVATGFNSLYGVALDGAGNLYLTDAAANAVYKETLQPGGTYLQSAIGTGWQSPNGLALDGSGDIAVTSGPFAFENYSPSVLEETVSGNAYSRSTVSTSIDGPVSVTFDASGTLFVAGDTFWLNYGDGCSAGVLPPAGGQGLWQETPEPGNTWLQNMVYTGSSEEVILNDYATGNLYLVDTGLTPNTCFDVWGQLYSRPAVPAAPLGFGSVLFGVASSPQAVSVYNQGNQPLKFSSIQFPTDFPESAGVATECKAGVPLPPAATCTLTAVFQPATSLRNGALSLSLDESITVTTNSVTGPQQNISLSGTEVAPTTASPVFSLPGGAYPSAQTITLTDATPGAAIYYTTDGTQPTTSSNKFIGAITVSATETIEAIAVASGYTISAIASATYTIEALTATPTFSPVAGSYPTVQFVSVTDATPGATIYYTTNGTTPTTSSTKYSGAIAVSATETIEAIAIASGYASSAVASATYTIVPSTTSELQFIPIPACRIADTRNPAGAFGGPELAGGSTRTFDIPQSACGIPSTAVAYSLNATVVPNATIGYLTVYPAGEAQPGVSTLNSDGRVKANATITPAGANGGVSVYTTDPTQFILDIGGYFVPAGTSASGLEFYPLAPCRVADTRNPTGALGGPFLTGDTSRAFPVQSSSCDIPSTAKAYSLNVTAVPHGGLGYLTAWPSGQTQPGTSTLNSSTGAVNANAALVPAGAGGDISIYVSNDADVILDVNGYFAPPAAGGLSLYTVTPCRALDTRSSSGPFDGTLTLPIHASTCAPSATARAYVLNATVLPVTSLSYLTFWAGDGAPPDVSTLNASDGAITSNMAIVPTTNGSVDAFTTDSTQMLLDLSGYFAP